MNRWAHRVRDWLRRVRRAGKAVGREIAGAASGVAEEYRIRYELTACMNFRDAAQYLAEWVEFHLLVGFEHFYLYNNNSADDYKAALKPYIHAGIVTLVEWPESPAFPKSYEDCLARHKHEARWIAFLDDDEFLFPAKRNDLRKVLRAYQRYPAVGVHWFIFGSSGRLKPPAGLMSETYLLREDGVNRHIKSIVNPRRVVRPLDTHHFLYQFSEWAVDERKRPIEGPKPMPAAADILRINHYHSKSLEDAEKKVIRGEQVHKVSPYSMEAWHRSDQSLNAVEDLCIQRFVPELKRRLEARTGRSFKGV